MLNEFRNLNSIINNIKHEQIFLSKSPIEKKKIFSELGKKKKSAYNNKCIWDAG